MNKALPEVGLGSSPESITESSTKKNQKNNVLDSDTDSSDESSDDSDDSSDSDEEENKPTDQESKENDDAEDQYDLTDPFINDNNSEADSSDEDKELQVLKKFKKAISKGGDQVDEVMMEIINLEDQAHLEIEELMKTQKNIIKEVIIPTLEQEKYPGGDYKILYDNELTIRNKEKEELAPITIHWEQMTGSNRLQNIIKENVGLKQKMKKCAKMITNTNSILRNNSKHIQNLERFIGLQLKCYVSFSKRDQDQEKELMKAALANYKQTEASTFNIHLEKICKLEKALDKKTDDLKKIKKLKACSGCIKLGDDGDIVNPQTSPEGVKVYSIKIKFQILFVTSIYFKGTPQKTEYQVKIQDYMTNKKAIAKTFLDTEAKEEKTIHQKREKKERKKEKKDKKDKDKKRKLEETASTADTKKTKI